MKFSIKDFFSSFLRIWLHLLKKSLMENFIFCGVFLIRDRKKNYKTNLHFQSYVNLIFCIFELSLLFSKHKANLKTILSNIFKIYVTKKKIAGSTFPDKDCRVIRTIVRIKESLVCFFPKKTFARQRAITK